MAGQGVGAVHPRLPRGRAGALAALRAGGAPQTSGSDRVRPGAMPVPEGVAAEPAGPAPWPGRVPAPDECLRGGGPAGSELPRRRPLDPPLGACRVRLGHGPAAVLRLEET